jgi:hypothetical protein
MRDWSLRVLSLADFYENGMPKKEFYGEVAEERDDADGVGEVEKVKKVTDPVEHTQAVRSKAARHKAARAPEQY